MRFPRSPDSLAAMRLVLLGFAVIDDGVVVVFGLILIEEWIFQGNFQG